MIERLKNARQTYVEMQAYY